MSEPDLSCGGKALLILKTKALLTDRHREEMTPHVQELAKRLGAEGVVLDGDTDLSVVPAGMDGLIAALQASVKVQTDLAAAIRRQADAIADLAEAVTAQQDEGDDPEGLGHLGTL